MTLSYFTVSFTRHFANGRTQPTSVNLPTEVGGQDFMDFLLAQPDGNVSVPGHLDNKGRFVRDPGPHEFTGSFRVGEVSMEEVVTHEY